ncbi:MAG: hypothetical protein KBA81_03275 [Rhabdochlamydiaceae bacterium]|nr:hypothetical protein [Rhabdochlamydiaceae bacterium]
MAIKIGYSSPYSRMDALAVEVCSNQLRKSKLEATLKELYPDGNIPDYFTIFQTLIDRIKDEMYQTFSHDACLIELLPKLKGESIDTCAKRHSASPRTMDSIERALSKLNFQCPPRSLTENNWCVIC